MRDSDIPEHEMTLLRKGPIQNGRNLLRARQVPMHQTRLQMTRSADPVLGRRLDGLDPERTQRVGEVVLLYQVQRSPLEQINGVDVLDHRPLLQILLHSRHRGELADRVVYLALCAYFEDLHVMEEG